VSRPPGADGQVLAAAAEGFAVNQGEEKCPQHQDDQGVDTQGERASVVTARGTRYAFRRRENGMWGLTLFTADLVAESERASRDL